MSSHCHFGKQVAARRLYDTLVTDSNYPEPRHPISGAKPIKYWFRPDGKCTWHFPRVRTGPLPAPLRPHATHVKIAEFADAIGMAAITVRGWAQKGKLGTAAVRVGTGHWRINLGAALDIMRANGVSPKRRIA